MKIKRILKKGLWKIFPESPIALFSIPYGKKTMINTTPERLSYSQHFLEFYVRTPERSWLKYKLSELRTGSDSLWEALKREAPIKIELRKVRRYSCGLM